MSVEPALLPPWKLELLERKRRQENAVHSHSGENAQDSSRLLSDKNALVDIPAWKRDILLRRQQQRGGNSNRYSNIEPSTSDNISEGVTRSASTLESTDIGERLLPIKKNPILLHDLEKRHQTSDIVQGDSFHSSNRSISPNASTDIHNSSNFSANSQQQDFNDFLPGEEGSMKYGKGFVHRLLQKFSGLTSAGDKYSNNSVSVKTSRRSRSPGQRILHDNVDHATTDIQKSSAEVTRSYDDLLQDPTSPSLLNNSSNLYGSVPNGLGNLSLSVKKIDDKLALADSRDHLDSVEPSKDEKPQANIVSNVRNMFEQFVTKPQVPPKRFAVQNMQSAAQSIFSDKKPSGVSGNAAKPATVCSNISANAVRNQSSTSTINNANNMHSPSSVVKKDINENDSLLVLASNDNKYTAAKDDPKVPVNHENISKTSPESNIDYYSQAERNNKNENIYNHDLPDTHSNQPLPDLPKNRNIEETTDYRAALKPTSYTDNKFSTNNDSTNEVAPTSYIDNIPTATDSKKAPSASYTDNKSSASNDSAKKAPPARPGKLVIRPASNLVASNTKSEYLELTKYNDVKTGEFAPASDRPLPQAGNGYDDDEDDDDLVGKSYAFIGGDVKLDRSLLCKTKPYARLSIRFDDNATSTYEYESEQSLMDATPAQPGDCDYISTEPASNSYSDHNDNLEEHMLSSTLMTTPALGGSTGSLASYKSRMQVNYQFGVNDSANDLNEPTTHAESTEQTVEPVEPVPAASWSGTGTSDLLF